MARFPAVVGDFFVTRNVATDVRSQLMAMAIQFGTASNVNHAGVFVGDDKVVEARPGGAGFAHVGKYLGPETQWSRWPLHSRQREAISFHARRLVGTPYGWGDIFAISLAQKRLGGILDGTKPVEGQPWWYRRIAREDRVICSELVDLAYFNAGVHLFDDGRPFGLVSPGDLEHLISA